MFGVMRPQNSCSHKPNSSAQFHRMHYCGVCKVIGTKYDQKSRMLLNYDTVFMAEVLSHLSQEKLEQWEAPLQRINQCFSLPKDADLPPSLEYAAAASLLLSELKIDDNYKDSQRIGWKLLDRFYSTSFNKATQQLEKWNVPIDSIKELITVQHIKEQNGDNLRSAEEQLDFYADATAQITALIFEAGGLFLNIKKNLYNFGFEFGRLMYLLDALEDYEKDIFKKQFNPFAARWNFTKSLSCEQLECMRLAVTNAQQRVVESLKSLPLDEASCQRYQEQLISNIALRIYKERSIPTTKIERLKKRWQHALSYASASYCKPSLGWKQLNFYLLAWAVFISPDAAEYVPQDGRMEIFKWSAFITAALAGIGISGVIRRNRKETKKKRKAKKRLRRLLKGLKAIFYGKNTCCESCCSSCCNGCCESCCQTISESETPWFWILLLLGLLLLTGLIVLILYLAGVI